MDRTDIDIAAIRQALLDERAALEAANGATAEERATVALDQQSVGRLSRMDALQVQEMAKAHAARRQKRLKLIAAALNRIETGEFGICASCGEDIPVKRLVLDPTFCRCVDCAG